MQKFLLVNIYYLKFSEDYEYKIGSFFYEKENTEFKSHLVGII